jgi:hypothetical protein
MAENTHFNHSPSDPPTPAMTELLKMIEAQTAARRAHRRPAGAPFRSTSFRYGSLIAIAVFAFGSFGVLEWLLAQMPKPGHSPAATPHPEMSTAAVKNGSIGNGQGGLAGAAR